MTTADPTSESREHATPGGGVRSTIYYLNDARESVPKSQATAAEIVEFDEAGMEVARTYLESEGSRSAPPPEFTPAELLAAIVQARIEGDLETVKRLEDLAATPPAAADA